MNNIRDAGLNKVLNFTWKTEGNSYIKNILSLINKKTSDEDKFAAVSKITANLKTLENTEKKQIGTYEKQIKQLDLDIRYADASQAKDLAGKNTAIKQLSKKYQLNMGTCVNDNLAGDSLGIISSKLMLKKEKLTGYLAEHKRRLAICEDALARCINIKERLEPAAHNGDEEKPVPPTASETLATGRETLYAGHFSVEPDQKIIEETTIDEYGYETVIFYTETTSKYKGKIIYKIINDENNPNPEPIDEREQFFVLENNNEKTFIAQGVIKRGRKKIAVWLPVSEINFDQSETVD